MLKMRFFLSAIISGEVSSRYPASLYPRVTSNAFRDLVMKRGPANRAATAPKCAEERERGRIIADDRQTCTQRSLGAPQDEGRERASHRQAPKSNHAYNDRGEEERGLCVLDASCKEG